MKPITIHRYDSDLKPDIFFEASIGRHTLYITTERQSDGTLAVEPNHGFEPESPEYRRDQQLFDRHKAAIRAAAERFLPPALALTAPVSAMTKLKNFAPTQYDHKGMNEPDKAEWLVVCSRHRDSKTIDISNFSTAHNRLTEHETNDVGVIGSGHWMVGYVETLIVRPGTPSADLAERLHDRIRDNIILDEDDVSRLEHENYQESWQSWGASEFASALCKKTRLSENNINLIENTDRDMLQEYFDRLNECGDYTDEDGSPVIRHSIARVTKENLAEFLADCRLEGSARKRAYEAIIRPGSTILSQLPEESANRMIDRCQKYMTDNPSFGLNRQTAERAINAHQEQPRFPHISEDGYAATAPPM